MMVPEPRRDYGIPRKHVQVYRPFIILSGNFCFDTEELGESGITVGLCLLGAHCCGSRADEIMEDTFM